jgi:hypothetical protein
MSGFTFDIGLLPEPQSLIFERPALNLDLVGGKDFNPAGKGRGIGCGPQRIEHGRPRRILFEPLLRAMLRRNLCARSAQGWSEMGDDFIRADTAPPLKQNFLEHSPFDRVA